MARRRSYWERLVGEFERSGLTQADFAERRGVLVGTLRYWIYKLRGETRAAEPKSVELVPVRVASSAVRHFEAQVAGVGFRFEVGTEPGYVAAVLRELGAAC